jgi:hypothetical protein
MKDEKGNYADGVSIRDATSLLLPAFIIDGKCILASGAAVCCGC